MHYEADFIFRLQKEFKSLKNLDLFNCDVTQIENYREKLFQLIPSLKFLDGFDSEDREAEDSEIDEDDDEKEVDGDSDGGKFLRVMSSKFS